MRKHPNMISRNTPAEKEKKTCNTRSGTAFMISTEMIFQKYEPQNFLSCKDGPFSYDKVLN